LADSKFENTNQQQQQQEYQNRKVEFSLKQIALKSEKHNLKYIPVFYIE
jgi:hypothetical protein